MHTQQNKNNTTQYLVDRTWNRQDIRVGY